MGHEFAKAPETTQEKIEACQDEIRNLLEQKTKIDRELYEAQMRLMGLQNQQLSESALEDNAKRWRIMEEEMKKLRVSNLPPPNNKPA